MKEGLAFGQIEQFGPESLSKVMPFDESFSFLPLFFANLNLKISNFRKRDHLLHVDQDSIVVHIKLHPNAADV